MLAANIDLVQAYHKIWFQVSKSPYQFRTSIKLNQNCKGELLIGPTDTSIFYKIIHSIIQVGGSAVQFVTLPPLPEFLLIYHAMRLFCLTFPSVYFNLSEPLCNPEIFKWLWAGRSKHLPPLHIIQLMKKRVCSKFFHFYWGNMVKVTFKGP